MTDRWRAPGRVNLIGDHTDYCEGFVLPIAIDRECVVAASPRSDRRLRARSAELDGAVDVSSDGDDAPEAIDPAWGRFVAGAVQALTERGARVPGLDLAITSTVPVGSGLSSSSALSVALTLALAGAAEYALDARDAARAALDAEVRATGVPGGIMDQLTALLAVPEHALLIDCRELAVEPIPLPPELLVVVVHSGLARTLAGSEYAQRRAACEAAAARLGLRALRDATIQQAREDPVARHVVTENARVLEFAAALRAGDVEALGPLLLASHASLRDDYRVSTPQLDLLVELLVDAGALGARLTGAGFGGCVVALCSRAGADGVLSTVMGQYRAGTELEPGGFVVRAGRRAGRVDQSA